MTIKQKQCLLAYLGYYTGEIDSLWGDMSRQATEAFQRDYQLTVDGDFGDATAQRIREVIYNQEEPPKAATEDSSATGMVWPGVIHFDPEEVRCKCGGKFCNGFPHEMQPLVMQIAERARQWSGHPIQIISGLRCETHNRNEKGVWNSQHMFGEALDVYFYGKTPGQALAWLQSQPDVRYAYQITGSNNIHFDIQPVGR